ncbi:MAG: glycosyl hydrolase family 39 [Acidobacteriales bacterium]|nr:glycosyl hydrolase family 39 [Terriglobales bacterium]
MLKRLLLCFFLMGSIAAQTSGKSETITINESAPAQPFPHFWEHMFGSGRAVLSLRESYRNDLAETKKITDLQYVRFHGIFLDDVGVYDEDAQGNPVYNFSYVDQIYDGLLKQGVRPFVELSFMPYKLASAPQAIHAFWYKQNVSPPKDWAKWDDLVTQFAKHLVERYGIDEVSRWYFEVWNEPNIDFWAGDPKQKTYFELYDHSATALKKVSPRLRVGGPATAQAAWADAFIQHCAQAHVPVDFISSHVYGNDSAQDVFHTSENIPRDQMVCRAVKKVHEQIKASPMPQLPLIWSEFNASYKNEPEVTDSTFMGPWLADTIRQCDGLVNEMSYWTFSDVFEEQGVAKEPFYGGYGLIAIRGIPKPAFNAFKVLHHLGTERLAVNSDSALVTRKPDGSLQVAIWNLQPPGSSGAKKDFVLRFPESKQTEAQVWMVDEHHGDFHATYKSMGSARYPSEQQIEQLRSAAELQDPTTMRIPSSGLVLRVPAHGLALVEVK